MAGLMTIYGCEASLGAGPETAGEVKHIFGVKTRSVCASVSVQGALISTINNPPSSFGTGGDVVTVQSEMYGL